MTARALRACAFVAALAVTAFVMSTLGEGFRGLPQMPWSGR